MKRLTGFVTALVFPLLLAAQQSAQIPQKQATSTETEAETVAKCLEDLKSPQVELRRRAALLIGKYSTPQAQEALLSCLQDPDRDVRQAALVSLTEDNALPQAAKPWIFRLLKDPDVHIRRLASSLLPDAIGVSMTGLSFNPSIRIKAGGNRTPEENQEALSCMEAALADSDTSVRRNVLRASRFFPIPFSAQVLEPFFGSADNELRCLALLAYESTRVDSATRIAKISPLANDRFPQVRTILVTLAASCGNDGIPLLRQLMADPDMTVRLEAIRQYVQSLQPDSLPVLKDTLLDESIPEAQRAKLVHLIIYFKSDCTELLTQLVASKAPAIQAEALRFLAMGRNGSADLDVFFTMISSDNAAVRRQCILAIQRQLLKPSPEQLKKLTGSPYPDVRQSAIQSLLFRVKDKAALEAILLDACTDDIPAIRAIAIRQAALRRIDGWQDILEAAAEDDAEEVRRVAEQFKKAHLHSNRKTINPPTHLHKKE